MQIPFQSSERASLGVEWELQLVDRETRELSAGAVEILEEIRPDGAEEHPKAKHELLQSTDRDHHRHLHDGRRRPRPTWPAPSPRCPPPPSAAAWA